MEVPLERTRENLSRMLLKVSNLFKKSRIKVVLLIRNVNPATLNLLY